MLLAFVCIVGSPSIASAACDPTKPIACAKSVTAELLKKETPGLEEKKFSVTDPALISVVDKEDIEEFLTELEAGADYAIVAACGDKCTHVRLGLLNDQQQQIAVTDDKQQVVILNGSVPAKGLYSLTVSAPGCAHTFCGVGVLVMRK
jgi:hypothetical protein